MALSMKRSLVVSLVAALSGCSFASEALFPSTVESEGGAEGTAQPAGQSASQGGTQGAAQASASGGAGAYGAAPPPQLGSTTFDPPPISTGPATGTFVGQKVVTLRNELSQLQGTISQRNGALQAIRGQTEQDSRAYHEAVATINARLQVGTTPGNPVLVERWRQAQDSLGRLEQDTARMNDLATQVASDSAMAAYLLDSVRAARNLTGAVEEDHRQLRVLEDETNQTVVLIERLLGELSRDVGRQRQYIASEKSNLNTLAVAVKNGSLYGNSLANQAASATLQPTRAPQTTSGLAGLPMAGVSGQRPLVVIRFDQPNVNYEDALYQAVSQATQRYPQADYELVAVSPAQGTPGQQALSANQARRSAENVLRSLSNMGLSPDRVRLTAMRSRQAAANEVHLYVR
ncbi:hypothetical protein [Roseospirillum parvum]|uniref:OmpA family protein n=1 Tax=Roseospirillum parvum TaxID=83401 RepID=A0A1G7XS60_9PROT|nr:hypothetical protein [Roseospirillum parvum]SDG86961.1 hypothetical protein SAMN05421742_10376 [Roseospirillum parvum]